MADAGAVHRVVLAEEVALHVADGEQAGNRLVLGGEHLGVGVHVEAEGDGQRGAHVLRGVERRGLHGREPLRGHVEVDVLAGLGHAVVALDGGLERVGRDVQLLGQVIQRVGLDQLAVAQPLLHDGVQPVGEAIVALGLLLHDVGLVVRVEDGPGHVARGVHAGVRQHGLEGHLGAVALAVGVHGKPAHDERGQVELERVQRELVDHRGGFALRHGRAGPHAHEQAVAVVEPGRRVAVGVRAVRDGAERVDHLLVAADVARGQDHALLGVVLHVLAVLRGGDDAGDAACRVAHQLLGARLEHELGAVVHGGVVHELAQRHVDRLAVIAHVVRLAAAHEGDGIGIDAPTVGQRGPVAVLRGAGQRGHHAHAVLGSQILDVVEHLAGARRPHVDEVVVRGLVRRLVQESRSHARVEVETVRFVVLAADVPHVHAAHGERGVALDDHRLRAVAGGGFGGVDARQTRAYDHHVEVLRLGDVGDGLGRDFPRMLRAGRLAALRRALGVGCVGRCGRAACRKRDGGGCGGAGDERALQEIPAVDIHPDTPSLGTLRGPSPFAPAGRAAQRCVALKAGCGKTRGRTTRK